MEISKKAKNGQVIAIEVAGARHRSLPQTDGLLVVEKREERGEEERYIQPLHAINKLVSYINPSCSECSVRDHTKKQKKPGEGETDDGGWWGDQ